MTRIKWWMRVVGVFYLLQFVMMVFVRAPIQAIGPKGALELASAGDPLASFLVDTWIAFGLEVGVLGAGLLIFSGKPDHAKALVWTVIGIELVKGPAYDIYMIVRGYELTAFVIWIVIHTVIIVTGIYSLRKAGPAGV